MTFPSFEEMRKLAEENPEELENLRRKEIDSIINSARNEEQKRKLRGLQFKIDAERSITKNPMALCIKLSDMMKSKFEELRESLNDIKDLPLVKKSNTQEPAKVEPKILPLNSKSLKED